MIAAVARPTVILAAVAGVAAGYLVWLAAGAIIVATLPVRFWAAAAALLLVTLIVGAVFAGRRHQGLSATALLWSPALPVLASIYLFISLIH